jgi:hypothetical protein
MLIATGSPQFDCWTRCWEDDPDVGQEASQFAACCRITCSRKLLACVMDLAPEHARAHLAGVQPQHLDEPVLRVILCLVKRLARRGTRASRVAVLDEAFRAGAYSTVPQFERLGAVLEDLAAYPVTVADIASCRAALLLPTAPATSSQSADLHSSRVTR